MALIATTKRLILGAGPTGQAVARHFQTLGIRFEVADTRTSKTLKSKFHNKFPGVKAYFGPLKTEYLDQFEEIVVSPGVAPTTEGISNTNSHLISDIQVFRRAWPEHQSLVAITGSNAKSTVTHLVAEILKADGRDVLVGGNLGPQALDLLPQRKDHSIAVLELSSFQLERTLGLRATVATCLNMSPDHLDWHGSMIAYHRAKHRIFEGAGAAVVNAEDPLSQPLIPDQTPVINFALKNSDFRQFGLMVHDDATWISLGTDPWMPVDSLPMPGRHMIQNAMAAFAICHLLGVNKRTAVSVLEVFRGLPHRMTEISGFRGIRFINDSKGTNTGASETAVRSVCTNGRLFLLAGGESKDADLGRWAEVVKAYCHHVFVYGKDRDRFAAILGSKATVFETLDRAFEGAVSHASDGDVVLLSPACASFDQFSSYEERGHHFTHLVEKNCEA